MINKLVSPFTIQERQASLTHLNQQQIINQSVNCWKKNICNRKYYQEHSVAKSDRSCSSNQFLYGQISRKKQLIHNFNSSNFNKNHESYFRKTVDSLAESKKVLSASPQVSPASEKNEVDIQMKRFFLIRSTLKNINPSKSPHKDSKLSNQLQNLISASSEFPPPAAPPLLFFLDRQNEKLKKQNMMLKKQLNTIKTSLLFGSISKKEEMIVNLTNSLNKQISLIFQLKIKSELLNKKVIALEALVCSKDEEIQFLNSKLSKAEQYLKQYQQKSQEKLQLLEGKISLVLQLYQDLQIKIANQELNDHLLQEQWKGQKGLYLDRISFLEKYIATTI